MSLQHNKFFFFGALFLAVFTISGQLFAQEGDFYTDQETQDNVSTSEWTPPQEGGMVMPSQDNDTKVTPHSTSTSKNDVKSTFSKPDKTIAEKSQKTAINNKQSSKEDDFDSIQKDEDTVMSFNFLYYLIHKFKYSESIQ